MEEIEMGKIMTRKQINRITDFLYGIAAVLVIFSLVHKIREDLEEVKTYQTTQLVMLEKLTILQTVESNFLKKVKENKKCGGSNEKI